jgi:hypothetical protein
MQPMIWRWFCVGLAHWTAFWTAFWRGAWRSVNSARNRVGRGLVGAVGHGNFLERYEIIHFECDLWDTVRTIRSMLKLCD